MVGLALAAFGLHWLAGVGVVVWMLGLIWLARPRRQEPQR